MSNSNSPNPYFSPICFNTCFFNKSGLKMEFPFLLSELFPREISIIAHNDLIPVGCPGLEKLGAKTVRERVALVIDSLGEKSDEAHNLHSEKTNAQTTLKGLNKKIYIFCDLQTNQAVGLLKIGKKHLFIFDGEGTLHEMHPMCILDFYIHESRQRKGAGNYLFDYMLKEEDLKAEHFTIDSPSDKMILFMKRHYEMSQIIPQINHFIVYKGFFNKRRDHLGKTDVWGGPGQFLGEKGRAIDPRNGRTGYEDALSYNEELLSHLQNCHQQNSFHSDERKQLADHSLIGQPSLGDGPPHCHSHLYGHCNMDSCNWLTSKYNNTHISNPEF